MDIKTLESFKMSDAISFHDELNPKIWIGQRLRPEVLEHLKRIAEDFLDELGIDKLEVGDLTLSGSNAAYSYTPHSDLDLHVLVDMSKLPNDEVYRELFNAKKNIYNDSHDIKIHGIPVELYVQDINEPVKSLGEYSLLQNKWLRIPTKRRANFDQTATKAKYDKLLHLIKTALKSRKYSKVKNILDTIKRYRQAGLDKGGEFGPENLAFKALRSEGYITKLYDLRDKLHSETLTIETMYQNPSTLQESNNQLKFKITKKKNAFLIQMFKGNLEAGQYQYSSSTNRHIAEVFPEFKGQGYGKLLILKAIETAGNLGMDFIEDESRTDEYDNAIASLESSGYIVSDDGYLYMTEEGLDFLNSRISQLKEDTQNKPIRAYHGNQGGIDASRLVAPMWFTQSLKDAKHYAGSDGYIVVADLVIKNPYVIQPGDETNAILNQWQKLKSKGYDGIYDESVKDWIPFSKEQIHVVEVKDTYRPKNLKTTESKQSNSYDEVEFVCANDKFPDSTDLKLQQQLFNELKKIDGVIPLFQDWGDGQTSLTAIYKGAALKKQILMLAKRLGVEIDLIQPVSDDYVDRAIRGEHEGQLIESADMFGNSPNITKSHLKSDIKDVAEWLNTTPDNILFEVKYMPISMFMKQIKEMYDSYDEFPEDAERTNRIVNLIQSKKDLKPIYVEKNDPTLFVMEGRHRMVAFWLLGLKSIPVCFVSTTSKRTNESASGYIPSNAEKNDPRFKTALTVDIKPNTLQKNAKKLGSKISRAGIPPLLRP